MKIFTESNNDFLCANILEEQAQWREKSKGENVVIVNNTRDVNGSMKISILIFRSLSILQAQRDTTQQEIAV